MVLRSAWTVRDHRRAALSAPPTEVTATLRLARWERRHVANRGGLRSSGKRSAESFAGRMRCGVTSALATVLPDQTGVRPVGFSPPPDDLAPATANAKLMDHNKCTRENEEETDDDTSAAEGDGHGRGDQRATRRTRQPCAQAHALSGSGPLLGG